jgi:asparagine synthase (glutamine-hydrolysing)
MCGIGGILRSDGDAIPASWLDALDERISPRGPDGAGRFTDRVEVATPAGTRTVEVALVHRRLSIIDLHDGAQPMISPRGRDPEEDLVAVVCNGCIYNHRELRRELESRGRAFVTDHSDTEVLIHGYREWGETLTEHLEGMYAFAIWDRRTGGLLLARDWFGEKPLYVMRGLHGAEDGLAFASDAAALAALSPRPLPEPDASALHAWTASYLQLGYNWSQQTVYASAVPARGVHAVPPTIRELHEDLIPARPRETHSQRDIEDLLDQAVARRLEADVPLACFLSGGVDSSLIAHFARRHEPNLRTFSVRMPDERYDESAHAEAAAAHLGTDHTTLDVAPNPAEDLVALVRGLGQPFGDSSILPTYWVSKAARAHVKVALSGDGGDELFIGYERYLAARHLVRHRRVLRWLPRRWLRGGHPTSRRHKLGRLGAMARDLPKLGILAMESIFTQEQITALLGVEPAPAPEQPWGLDPMQALRRIDLASYLPDDLLMKVDTASMAVPLEVRAPYLDRDLVRAVLAAPTWQLVPGGQRKGLLRSIARRHLPAAIVDRPKMGFAIPIGEWFREDHAGLGTLLRDHLEGPDAFGPVPVRPAAARRLLDEHMGGVADHGQRLFTLLTLSIWARSRS